jgi:hypothetical protein
LSTHQCSKQPYRLYRSYEWLLGQKRQRYHRSDIGCRSNLKKRQLKAVHEMEYKSNVYMAIEGAVYTYIEDLQDI